MTTLNVLLLYVARRHYNCEIHDQPPGRSQACHGSGVRYEVAFELKYVKKGETIDVAKELDKAEIQLMNYMVSKKFIERPSLKAFVVLVHGIELHSREMNLAKTN